MPELEEENSVRKRKKGGMGYKGSFTVQGESSVRRKLTMYL